MKHKILNVYSLEKILEDFKSLEDESSHLENNHTFPQKVELNNVKEFKQCFQLQDFRRPKFQIIENKLNRSYSLNEIKEHGLQLKSISKASTQQKSLDHSILLSEFIL